MVLIFKKVIEHLKNTNFKRWDVLAAGTAFFLILLFLGKCVYAETVVRAAIQYEPKTQTFGRQPTGAIRIQHRVFDYIWIGYEHHSSIADEDDRNVFDAVEVMIDFPFGKRGCR